MKTRIKRDRVILGKTSLETLAELHETASKVDLAVVIGCLPKGTEFEDESAILIEPLPFYMVINGGVKIDDAIVPGTVCFTKEDVLKRIIEVSRRVKTRGDNDGDL